MHGSSRLKKPAQPGEVLFNSQTEMAHSGSEALSTRDSETPAKARYIGTESGTHARVSGVNGDGNYRLFH